MQRETLYLAIDFIDRYLAKTSNVQKSSLQLVGVTALFIAAKAEVTKDLELSALIRICLTIQAKQSQIQLLGMHTLTLKVDVISCLRLLYLKNPLIYLFCF